MRICSDVALRLQLHGSTFSFKPEHLEAPKHSRQQFLRFIKDEQELIDALHTYRLQNPMQEGHQQKSGSYVRAKFS